MFIVPNTAGPGAYLTLKVYSPTFGLDLTTVTALSTLMQRRDGSTATLNWTIIAASGSLLVAQYAFVGTEFTGTGAYNLGPILAAPGGNNVPCRSVLMFVTTPFKCDNPTNEAQTWVAASSQVSPTSSAQRQQWNLLNLANQVPSPFAPFNKVDSSGGALVLPLWAPTDGDLFVLSDYKGHAAAHNVTINPSAGFQVPTGVGTFGGTVVQNVNGFILRWKADATEGLWIPW